MVRTKTIVNINHPSLLHFQLATDMSTHFVQIKTMKNMLTLPEGIDKMKALCLIVHACDMWTSYTNFITSFIPFPIPIQIQFACLKTMGTSLSMVSWIGHKRLKSGHFFVRTEGVLEEFFRQGDLEASMGLPYSPLCDRHTTHVAESQIGFIDFIVEVSRRHKFLPSSLH